MNTKASEISVLVTMLALFPIASLADTRAGGEETISNVAVDNVCDEGTDVWDVLDAEALTTTTHSNCIVTACSDVANASIGTTDNDYIFTISLSDTSPGLNTAAERSLELADNPNVNDPGSWPVCSTRFFSINPGTYTIYWLGCRESAADVPTTVNDTSLTIGCFNNSEL